MAVQQSNSEPCEVFRALGDQTRLRVFRMLGAACGCGDGCDPSGKDARRTLAEMAAALNVGAPTISHHLKELRRVGLILYERRGRRAHCRVNHALLRELSRFVDALSSPPVRAHGRPPRGPRSKEIR